MKTIKFVGDGYGGNMFRYEYKESLKSSTINPFDFGNSEETAFADEQSYYHRSLMLLLD